MTPFFLLFDGFSPADTPAPEPEPEPAPVATVSGGGRSGGGNFVFTRPVKDTPRPKRKKRRKDRLPLANDLPLVVEPFEPLIDEEQRVREEAERQRREHHERLLRYDEAYILARGRSLAIWEELLDG